MAVKATFVRLSAALAALLSQQHKIKYLQFLYEPKIWQYFISQNKRPENTGNISIQPNDITQWASAIESYGGHYIGETPDWNVTRVFGCLARASI